MKSLIFFLLHLAAVAAVAQTTAGRIKWNGYNDINFTYTGEIKDGVPDGKGLAVSDDGGSMKYFGDFKNGKFDGYGLMLINDGSLFALQWKNNVATGVGVTVSAKKDLMYGMFVNSKMEGKSIELGNYDEIMIGTLTDRGYDGRVIEIGIGAEAIYDHLYTDGKNAGPGYSIIANSKEKSVGYFDDHILRYDMPVNYPSFMRSDKLTSYLETESKYWFVSNAVNENGKMLPQDTCLYVDNTNRTRKFGNFDHGELVDGIVMRHGEIRTLGHYEFGKLKGPGVLYKKDDYLVLGSFEADKINGYALVYNMADSILILGNFIANSLEGSGALVLANQELRVGDFKEGSLNGFGNIIHADGNVESGMFVMDNIKKKPSELPVVLDNQLPPVVKPATSKEINTAVNFLLKSCEDRFKSITGKEKQFILTGSLVMLNALYAFPGSRLNSILKDTVVTGAIIRPSFYSTIGFYDDLKVALNVYDQLCKQIATCRISSLQKGKEFKLVTTGLNLPQIYNDKPLVKTFIVLGYTTKTHPPVITIKLEKINDGRYSVLFIAAPK